MMDTLEGNKLIAEFVEYPTEFPRTKFSTGGAYIVEVVPDFHNDWNLLIAVVEKIRDISEMGTLGNTISYLMSRIMTSYTNLKGINDLWLAVVDWIEYNNQSK